MNIPAIVWLESRNCNPLIEFALKGNNTASADKSTGGRVSTPQVGLHTHTHTHTTHTYPHTHTKGKAKSLAAT